MISLLLSAWMAFGPQDAPPPAPAPVAPAQAAAPAPRKLYAEGASANAQIAAAVASAAEDGIRVLVNWGSNDDDRCARFPQAQRVPAMARKFSDEFKVVYVDVGRAADRNLDVMRAYGVTASAGALPHFTVLDAAGKVLAQLKGSDVASGPARADIDARKLATFLSANQAPPPPDAQRTFDAAFSQARTERKAVFLWFAAPWCSWCHRLGAWMTSPDVAPILARAFVSVKIDADRAPSASDLAKRYQSGGEGLPWFVFIDPAGQVLATSTGPGGNIGFPSVDDERAHFRSMLEKTKPRLTDEDIAALMAALKAAAPQTR
jgi:hypothetical protein